MKDPGATRFAGKTSFYSHVGKVEDPTVLAGLTEAIRKQRKETAVPKTQTDRRESLRRYTIC